MYRYKFPRLSKQSLPPNWNEIKDTVLTKIKNGELAPVEEMSMDDTEQDESMTCVVCYGNARQYVLNKFNLCCIGIQYICTLCLLQNPGFDLNDCTLKCQCKKAFSNEIYAPISPVAPTKIDPVPKQPQQPKRPQRPPQQKKQQLQQQRQQQRNNGFTYQIQPIQPVQHQPMQTMQPPMRSFTESIFNQPIIQQQPQQQFGRQSTMNNFMTIDADNFIVEHENTFFPTLSQPSHQQQYNYPQQYHEEREQRMSQPHRERTNPFEDSDDDYDEDNDMMFPRFTYNPVMTSEVPRNTYVTDRRNENIFGSQQSTSFAPTFQWNPQQSSFSSSSSSMSVASQQTRGRNEQARQSLQKKREDDERRNFESQVRPEILRLFKQFDIELPLYLPVDLINEIDVNCLTDPEMAQAILQSVIFSFTDI